jgi:hypothetical protein
MEELELLRQSQELLLLEVVAEVAVHKQAPEAPEVAAEEAMVVESLLH